MDLNWSMIGYVLVKFILSMVVLSDGIKVNYEGHKVIRIHPHSATHLRILNTIEHDARLGLDFWGETIANVSIDIHVPPKSFKSVTQTIAEAGMTYSILIPNIQNLIDDEQKGNNAHGNNVVGRRKRSSGRRNANYFYNGNIVGMFARHGQINRWIKSAGYFRPRFVQTFDIGRSYEGRSMKVIKIGAGKGPRPAIWLDGGIHGREWISPATLIYIIYMLIANYKRHPVVTKLVEEFDWYILPVANPDGYEYTFKRDRMWRKSRRRTRWPCFGVDLNRNFGYHWLDCSRASEFSRRTCASRSPCAATYAGSRAFSEPETRAIEKFILRKKDRIKLFMSLHSYSQMWLTTWGFSRSDANESATDILNVARKGADGIFRIHGKRFKVGSPADILYPAAGGSFDWARGVAGIKYAYALELRDLGRYGFLLPVSQIIPSGEEVLSAILKVADHIIDEEKRKSKHR